jgi:hypothetical protein
MPNDEMGELLHWQLQVELELELELEAVRPVLWCSDSESLPTALAPWHHDENITCRERNLQ